MNAQVQLAVDFLHVARSAFIDAFAAVESSVCARLTKSGVSQPGSFGQKIEALRSVKASSTYSKAERGAVREHLEKLEKLNAIRCDVVHSRLHIVWIEGQRNGCFINPAARGDFSSTARLLSVGQFEALTQELGQIAKLLAPG